MESLDMEMKLSSHLIVFIKFSDITNENIETCLNEIVSQSQNYATKCFRLSNPVGTLATLSFIQSKFFSLRIKTKTGISKEVASWCLAD